jgi:hypothetical protein
MPKVALLWKDDGIAVANIGSVSISVLRQPATGARLKRLRGDLKQLGDAHPGKAASITIIERHALSAATEEVRSESALLMRESVVFAAAIVLEGKGFRQATTRALLAGLVLLSRPRHAQKIFEGADVASDWIVKLLAERGAHDMSAQELLLGVEHARSSLPALSDRSQ